MTDDFDTGYSVECFICYLHVRAILLPLNTRVLPISRLRGFKVASFSNLHVVVFRYFQ